MITQLERRPYFYSDFTVGQQYKLPDGSVVEARASLDGLKPEAKCWYFTHNNPPANLLVMWSKASEKTYIPHLGSEKHIFLVAPDGVSMPENTIRTSGEMLRKDVRPGESYKYVTSNGNPGPAHFLSRERLQGMPADWYLGDIPAAPNDENRRVVLIPRWDASPTLLRKDLKTGDTFHYVDYPHEKIIVADVKPSDLPTGWKYSNSNYGGNPLEPVVLIPSYRAEPLLRKDLKQGDTFYYNQTPTAKFIVSDTMPADMPRDGIWDYSTQGSGSMTEKITRIPRWDAEVSPALRTSGESIRGDVKPGEAFQYTEGTFKSDDKYYKAVGSERVPAGWNLSTGDGAGASVRIKFIPKWDTTTALRTSGESIRGDVKPGEAFYYVETGSADSPYLHATKRPDGMPRSWSLVQTGTLGIETAGNKVRFVPLWNQESTEIRTSGKVLRKDVRDGESFTYEEDGVFRRIFQMMDAETRSPSDLPSGWGYDFAGTSKSATRPDRVVTLIPGYRTVLRTSGEKTTHKYGNSGRTYTFDVGKNSYTSELGWRPLDLSGNGQDKGFDPVAPIMAVHDLMEHFPGDEYAPHNEYMAQGAMLWLRYEGGFFGSPGSVTGVGVANAVVKPAFGMLYYHLADGKTPTKVFDVAGFTPDALTHMKRDTALVFYALVGGAEKYLRETYNGTNLNSMLDSLSAGVPWMIYGYTRAAARYAGLDQKRLVSLYKRTVEAISLVKEGSKLSLTMNYETYSSEVSISSTLKVAV